MSTRDKVIGMLDSLTAEQLDAIAVILSGMVRTAPPKKAADVKGALRKYANPALIPLEKGAWERDVAERAGNDHEDF